MAIPVIINATARNGAAAQLPERLRDAFRGAGAEADVRVAKNGDDLRALARRAAQERPAAVVAGGGDGTLSAVASALVGTGIPIGVLPLGTLNHFAKDLGIADEVEQAARDIVAGRSIEVDVGQVNGRIFLNNSGIGLYPAIVRRRERQRRQLGRGKWHALFWAAVTVLRRSPFLDLRISVDDAVLARRASFVFVGNDEYSMEGFSIGSRERLDSGLLSVYLAQRSGRLGLLGLALRALFGRLHQAQDFEAQTAQALRIETRHKRLLVAADGEIAVMDTPLDYRVLPRALRVIVPA